MTTVDLITALFYEVDEQLRAIPKHPEAHLWPSEVVTLGLVELSRRVTPLDWSPSRVENWRAHLRWRVSRRALSIARWVHSSTIVTFPAPATSNAACGFPALRFPVRFMSRVMRPSVLGVLSAAAGAPGSCCTSPGADTATAYSTSSSRSPCASVHAS